MSTRAAVAAALASLGVLVVGWQAGVHAWAGAPALENATPGQSDSQLQGGGSSSSSATSTTGSGTPRSGGTSTSGNAGGSGSGRGAPGQFVPRGQAASGGSGSSAGTGGSASGASGSSGTSSVTLDVPAGASGTFTGTTESNRWGSVTVKVTLASGRITALTESIDDQGDNHSARINASAVPTLKQAILAASTGGKVSTISGATYTTKSYLASLQSALDQAG